MAVYIMLEKCVIHLFCWSTKFYRDAELRKVVRRSASRNSTGCAFLRCPINYGPYFSNSEELFALLLWIAQVQVRSSNKISLKSSLLFLLTSNTHLQFGR